MHSLTSDEDRRGSKRSHLYHTVEMQFGPDHRVRECAILDISDEGVRVYALGFDIPEEFVLRFSDVIHERYKVIWRRDREVGAKFIGREFLQNEGDLIAADAAA